MSPPASPDPGEDGFQLPPARFRAKRPKLNNNETITTSNRFTKLIDENVNPENLQNLSSFQNRKRPAQPSVTSSTSTNKTKFPPFYVFEQDTLIFIKAVKDLKMNCTYKAYSDHTRVIPQSEEDFKTLTSFLQANKIKYYTFSLAQDRPKKLVVKHLPNYIPKDIMITQFKLQGVAVSNAFNLKNKYDEPTSSYLIEVRKADLDKAYTINKLFDLDITVTPFQSKKGGIPQCHNCQRFGHSSVNCNLSPRCVKCGRSHATDTCAKPKESPATCTNCHGTHPANYRGCPYYGAIKAARNERMNNRPQTQANTSPYTRMPNFNVNQTYFPALPPKTNAWFPSANQSSRSAPPPPTQPTNSPNISDYLAEFDISKIFSSLQKRLPQLQQANDKAQRLAILVEVCAELLLD